MTDRTRSGTDKPNSARKVVPNNSQSDTRPHTGVKWDFLVTAETDSPAFRTARISVNYDVGSPHAARTENPHKKPSAELQFRQLCGSFWILTFLTRRLAVAIAKKGGDSSG